VKYARPKLNTGPLIPFINGKAFHELIEAQTHYAGRRGPQVQYFVRTRDVRKESRHSASAPLVKHTRDCSLAERCSFAT
jgi:hypothetical protein